MRKLNRLLAIGLTAVLLSGLCSCSSKTSETSLPYLQETIAVSAPDVDETDETTETTEETEESTSIETDLTEDTKYEISYLYPKYPFIHIGDLMGFEKCYAIGEEWELYTNWDIRKEDGQIIARQFSFDNREGPYIFPEDLDGDGIDELICPCQYSGDGGRDVFIYRNNNGVVEKGHCSLMTIDKTALETDCYYDEENDRIIFKYKGEETVVGIDDFTFEEFIVEPKE